MTYLITFSCYGARVHGDERGTVDRHHNWKATPGTNSLTVVARIHALLFNMLRLLPRRDREGVGFGSHRGGPGIQMAVRTHGEETLVQLCTER
jgi:hypothetical protein